MTRRTSFKDQMSVKVLGPSDGQRPEMSGRQVLNFQVPLTPWTQKVLWMSRRWNQFKVP